MVVSMLSAKAPLRIKIIELDFQKREENHTLRCHVDDPRRGAVLERVEKQVRHQERTQVVRGKDRLYPFLGMDCVSHALVKVGGIVDKNVQVVMTGLGYHHS